MNDFAAWLLVAACCFLGFVALRWFVRRLLAFARLLRLLFLYNGVSNVLRATRRAGRSHPGQHRDDPWI